MKIKHIWLFIISLFFWWSSQGQTDALVSENVSLTNETNTAQISNTVKIPKTYALRVGLDLIRPIKTQFDTDYQGLEIVGDLRLSRRFFVAVEIGSERKTQQTELINFTTNGSYFKLGFDYNFFNNWKGMNNALYIGLRYARSFHRHRVNHYELYRTDQYIRPPATTEGYLTGEHPQINNGWLELLFGTKVQLLPNLYAGISARLNILIDNPQLENFGNLYAPGFNKITDNNRFGAGINYTLSYAFPFRFKKVPPRAQ